jgi:hypothetical protein
MTLSIPKLCITTLIIVVFSIAINEHYTQHKGTQCSVVMLNLDNIQHNNTVLSVANKPFVLNVTILYVVMLIVVMLSFLALTQSLDDDTSVVFNSRKCFALVPML